MKIEQQVTSLEISKRLKELGVKQESIFYWMVDDTLDRIGHKLSHAPNYVSQLNRHNNYPAFTVAELFSIMPAFLRGRVLTISKRRNGDSYVFYKSNVLGLPADTSLEIPDQVGENLADCLGYMLRYLLETGLIV